MAEIALGVIPLTALAVSGFKAVQSRVKTYKHADRMVRRWDRELRGHARTFKEACRSALGCTLVGQPTIVSEMLESSFHQKWSDPELGKQLATLLGDRFRDWAETVGDIAETIKDLNGRLDKFTFFISGEDPACRSGGLGSQRLSIFTQRLKASFKEDDIQKSLEELGKLNRQLGELQTGLEPSANSLTSHLRSRGAPQAVPCAEFSSFQDLNSRRRALSGLHEGIARIWRCRAGEAGHTKHSIQLFLDSSACSPDNTVTKLGYTYQPRHSSHEVRLLELQVRSDVLVSPPPSGPDAMLTPEPEISSSDIASKPKRRKVLRWADDLSPEGPRTAASFSPSPSVLQPEVRLKLNDLVDSSDFCHAITQHHLPSTPTPAPGSSSSGTNIGHDALPALGHIDTPLHGFRHVLYPTLRDIRGRPGFHTLEPASDVLSLGDVLDQGAALTAEGYVRIGDRIRLARSLVAMVLRLHSTPWLARRWGLADVSFVRCGDDLAASLGGLFVECGLGDRGESDVRAGSGGRDAAMGYGGRDVIMQLTPEGSECSSSTDLPSDLAGGGGQNDLLWSLGMALLQTDCWVRVPAGYGGEDEWERERERKVVRQLLKSRPNIGTRFREITEQCLTGRWRCGSTDLNNPHLETEMARVLADMDNMVATLGKLGL